MRMGWASRVLRLRRAPIYRWARCRRHWLPMAAMSARRRTSSISSRRGPARSFIQPACRRRVRPPPLPRSISSRPIRRWPSVRLSGLAPSPAVSTCPTPRAPSCPSCWATLRERARSTGAARTRRLSRRRHPSADSARRHGAAPARFHRAPSAARDRAPGRSCAHAHPADGASVPERIERQQRETRQPCSPI